MQFANNRYKYEVETGRYEISFKIPVPDLKNYSNTEGIKKADLSNLKRYDTDERLIVEIILVVKSKAKALKYSKDDVIPLTGKITEITRGFIGSHEYVTIRLTE